MTRPPQKIKLTYFNPKTLKLGGVGDEPLDTIKTKNTLQLGDV